MSLADNIGLVLQSAFGGDETLPQVFLDLLDRLDAGALDESRAPGALSDAEFKAELTAAIPALRSFGRSLCRDNTLADDLVQDTMVRAWNARARFQAGTNFNSWTSTILRNGYLSQMRRKRFTADWNEEVMERKLTTSADQDRNLHLSDVGEALRKLPEAQRQALMLVGAEQMSYEEAAEVCDVPVGTIKSRVARGRAALTVIIDGESVREVSALDRRQFG
jgi:RNA polymerase sigma-70 factor (ECF subfamily)